METTRTLTNPLVITAEIRGGGSGRGAKIARVTGFNANKGLVREFLQRDGQVSSSGKSGLFWWTITEPGVYELRDLQYGKGLATVGELDGGYVVIDEAGEMTRVALETVIGMMTPAEPAAVVEQTPEPVLRVAVSHYGRLTDDQVQAVQAAAEAFAADRGLTPVQMEHIWNTSYHQLHGSLDETLFGAVADVWTTDRIYPTFRVEAA